MADASLASLTAPAAAATRPHEVAMAAAAVRVGAIAAAVAVPLATLARGLGGGITAAGAILLVVGSFALTGVAHGWASRRGPAVLQGVALGGMLLRLWLYAVLLVALSPVELIDGVTLAVTTPVVVIALLAYEVKFVSSHREFWHLDVADRKERA